MRRIFRVVASKVRHQLRSRGFDIVRYALPVEAPVDLLSFFVRSLKMSKQTLLLVQVGAHDGVMQDPVRQLVSRLGLDAVLFEPLPDAFARLSTSYASIPSARLVNAAIARADTTLPLFRIRADAPFGDWAQGIASFNRFHFRRFDVPGLDQYVEEISVPCLSWQTAGRNYGLANCDVLVVDTEGMDDEIVLGALDGGLRPSVIQYEWCHLSASRRAHLKSKLAEHGYSFADTGIDTVAVKEDVVSSHLDSSQLA
jgi:FkbM family methyltransferase